ncbi:HAD family hydrolase [Microbacterium halotolerans]|uniref:HAD family hydrolase n=1 Tax=Microbacterium halotolerans TaxID=246613 RepID=UPI0013C33FB9|nr:HAD family hydrolase [Microbacterium halotolerans]
MSPVKAVGFDLDETLFDHRGASGAGADAFAAHLGVDDASAFRAAWFAAEEMEFERWRRGEISFAEQRRQRLVRVLRAFGLEVPADASGLDAMFERYLAMYRTHWRAFPEAREVLASVRRAGLRVGVLTNGAEAQQNEKLSAIGLAEAVDVVCTSEGIGVHKPDAHAFDTLAGGLGTSPGECLFVGDNPFQDVEGARGAGMRALLIARDASDPNDLTAVLEVLGLAMSEPWTGT